MPVRTSQQKQLVSAINQISAGLNQLFTVLLQNKTVANPKIAKRRRRSQSGNILVPMIASSALAVIVGRKPLPRPMMTKRLWAYIVKHGLQDKNDPRKINADRALTKVFGGKSRVSMFEMTKLVSKHLR